MSANCEIPSDLQALFDDYISDALDVASYTSLEMRLRADPQARGYFVRYCQMHTDLCLEMRAQSAGSRALDALDRRGESESGPASTAGPHLLRFWKYFFAATVLVAAGLWWLGRGPSTQADQPAGIAWLINAQDCRWADDQAPGGDMRPGKVLKLQQGLAEIRFNVGAQVVLEGPAALELISGNSARLHHGKLTATVPAPAKGFQIVSPHGRVVDLGTEFGMSVAPDGWTDVYVFKGEVEAFARDSKPNPTAALSVKEKQAARIDVGRVALKQGEQSIDGTQFVRAIVPPARIVPRTFALDFSQAQPGTLSDGGGLGIGFTHRFPGTGKKLPANDKNLRLLPDSGHLSLKTTKTDINTTFRLDVGEYLGVRLSEHGFTGKEDFAVTVVVLDIPDLPSVGQFGLYAGPHSKRSIRGGMISSLNETGDYKQFLVENRDGKDMKPHKVGVGFPGDDIRLTLQRKDKNYSLTVKNLRSGSSSSVAMLEPEILAGENELYVGFFGANTQSDVQRTLMLKEFAVTVWTVSPPR